MVAAMIVQLNESKPSSDQIASLRHLLNYICGYCYFDIFFEMHARLETCCLRQMVICYINNEYLVKYMCVG
jgi:hypothetical protein